MSAPNNTPTRSEVETALTRSAVYLAFARALSEPTEEACAAARGPLALAMRSLGIEWIDGSGADAELAELSQRWLTLFGHTVKADVTPYETEYGKAGVFLQTQELADIAGFMTAFGVEVDPVLHERVDNICCELEFMAFLAQKEAYLLDHVDPDTRDETLRAQKLFLRDHLGQFAPAFGVSLSRVDPDGFYGMVGDNLRRFVVRECERLDVPAGPDHMAVRLPIASEEPPMACGGTELGPGGYPE